MAITKVILKENVKGLGKKFDICDVKRGHALNFLVPTGVASLATLGEIKSTKHKREKLIEVENKLNEKLSELFTKIDKSAIDISKSVSKSGKLFGSVTAKDIVDELNKKFDIILEPHNVIIEGHIKDEGDHKVIIDLGQNLKADLTVKVIKK